MNEKDSEGKENLPAPRALPGGRKNIPIFDTNTTPRPMARGPDIMRNFSEGAVIAVAERPEIGTVEEDKPAVSPYGLGSGSHGPSLHSPHSTVSITNPFSYD